MAKVTHSEKVPKAMQATFERIVNVTDHVAQQHLNDEYAQLVGTSPCAPWARSKSATSFRCP